MGVKFTGLQKAAKRWERKLFRLERVFDEIIDDGATEIMLESNRRVPVDTGLLISTSKSERVKNAVYEVSYSTRYAIYVHEDLSIAHPVHVDGDCGGEAKFLSNAVQAKKRMIIRNLRKAVRR